MEADLNGSKKRKCEEEASTSATHLLDYVPGLRPSFGVISPDLLGKATCALMMNKLSRAPLLDGLQCDMYWRQNRTESDGKFIFGGKTFEVEVKWSTIQLQANSNSNSSVQPWYHRWEFANIHPNKFDILVLFGQCSLQAGATNRDQDICKSHLRNQVVWDASPGNLEDWMASLYVWILRSDAPGLKASIHSNVYYSRSGKPYETKNPRVDLQSIRRWGGDTDLLAQRILACISQ